MGTEFSIDHVALHFVDPNLDAPHLSKKEVDLNSSAQAENLEILRNFFKDHLKKIWLDKESQKTCAASFKDFSNIGQFYEGLKADASQFFTYTCDMAKQLYEISPPNASKGILMVLLFKVTGEDKPFLGLLKMDPGRKDTIALGEDDKGNILLDLAVQTVKQALPDPTGEKVLKWAVIPHPTRHTFDVKVKDEQGGSDRAKYFMKFLGCEEKPSAVEQTEVLMGVLEAYTKINVPKGVECRRVVSNVVEKLAKSDAAITVKSVAEIIKESKVIDKFDEKGFAKKFEEAKAQDLCIPSDKLRDIKIQYTLPSGIIIKGPRDAMENYITTDSKDDGTKIIIIETPSYERKYV